MWLGVKGQLAMLAIFMVVISFVLSVLIIAPTIRFVNRFLKEFLNSFVTEELTISVRAEQPIVTATLVSSSKERIKVRGPEHQAGETATHEGERVHHRENILS
jgi:hypothetical protein